MTAAQASQGDCLRSTTTRSRREHSLLQVDGRHRQVILGYQSSALIAMRGPSSPALDLCKTPQLKSHTHTPTPTARPKTFPIRGGRWFLRHLAASIYSSLAETGTRKDWAKPKRRPMPLALAGRTDRCLELSLIGKCTGSEYVLPHPAIRNRNDFVRWRCPCSCRHVAARPHVPCSSVQ